MGGWRAGWWRRGRGRRGGLIAPASLARGLRRLGCLGRVAHGLVATRAWAAGGTNRSRVARARPPAAGWHRFDFRLWTKNGVSGAAPGQEQTGTTSSCTSTSYHLPVRAFFGDGLSAATPCFGWVRGSIRCRTSITTISFPIRVRRSQLGSQGRVLRYAAAPLALCYYAFYSGI